MSQYLVCNLKRHISVHISIKPKWYSKCTIYISNSHKHKNLHRNRPIFNPQSIYRSLVLNVNAHWFEWNDRLVGYRQFWSNTQIDYAQSVDTCSVWFISYRISTATNLSHSNQSIFIILHREQSIDIYFRCNVT